MRKIFNLYLFFLKPLTFESKTHLECSLYSPQHSDVFCVIEISRWLPLQDSLDLEPFVKCKKVFSPKLDLIGTKTVLDK